MWCRFVPTDGPCYIGFKPGTEIHPGIQLDCGTACQVGSNVYRNPKYDPTHQPGYLATNGYTHGNSTNGSNKDKTDYETAHGDVHRSQSDFLSAKRELDTTVALAQNQRAKYLEMCKKNQFRKLAIECRVAQVTANKGVKVSQDGTVYSEFLTQVQSQPDVWQGVLHAQKSLPTDVSKSIEAMFSSAGRKKGFLNSLTASVSKVFENTVPEKVITLPPNS